MRPQHPVSGREPLDDELAMHVGEYPGTRTARRIRAARADGLHVSVGSRVPVEGHRAAYRPARLEETVSRIEE